MELTGVGLYTPQQAARITGAEPREVSRWLFGYARGDGRWSPPLWETQVKGIDEKVIGFRDLIELRFVKEFVRRGVPLQVVRSALHAASELWHTDYPFTARRFLTDGKRIFHEALSVQKPELMDLGKRQFVFGEIIRPSLYAGIEFTKAGAALRWYPMNKSRAVVLDPQLSFGRPVLAAFGIPTDVIAQAVRIEKNKKLVAAQFDIPTADVAAAVKYEESLPLAA